jgi:taurine dioxygenase
MAARLDSAQSAQTARNPVNAPEAIEIVPTGKALGAEVRGMDLSQPVPAAAKAKLREAWAQHLVLLWRGQRLPDNSFLEAAEIFGTTKEPAARKYQVAGGYKVGGNSVPLDPRVSLISNLDEDGHPVLDNGGLGSYEVVWHSDNSYVEVLRPTVRMPTRPEEVPGPVHPLVRVHPVSGRKALYLGRRRDWPSNYILGMPNDESERLLDKLWAHATQDKYAWGHKWRVGDLVLWDNRCAMHYRSEVDPTQARVLLRTVVEGEPLISG